MYIIREAERHLAKLPLVRVGKSTSSVEILEPYQGYEYCKVGFLNEKSRFTHAYSLF